MSLTSPRMPRELDEVRAERLWIDVFALVQVPVAVLCHLAVLTGQEVHFHVDGACSAQVAGERCPGVWEHPVYTQALCPQNQLPAISQNVSQTGGNAAEHQHEGNEDHYRPYRYGVRLEIKVFLCRSSL